MNGQNRLLQLLLGGVFALFVLLGGAALNNTNEEAQRLAVRSQIQGERIAVVEANSVAVLAWLSRIQLQLDRIEQRQRGQ